MPFNRAYLLAIGLLFGCAGKNVQPGTSTLAMMAPFSSANYAVSPTDVLRLDIFQEKDLSGEYYVDPSGTINLPLVGRVAVAGLNVNTIERKLEDLFSRGYIVSPDIRVSVISYRPIYVSGEIHKPGEYRFTPGMTVQQAIVLAGGTTKFAAKKYYLQRNNVGEDDRIRVGGNSLLFPGDVLTIGERFF